MPIKPCGAANVVQAEVADECYVHLFGGESRAGETL